MEVCYKEDGISSLDDEGVCKGCGETVEYIESELGCCGKCDGVPSTVLGNKIHDCIDEFRDKEELSWTEVIGVLEIIKQDIYMELLANIENKEIE